jgi:hypothetical protein
VRQSFTESSAASARGTRSRRRRRALNTVVLLRPVEAASRIDLAAAGAGQQAAELHQAQVDGLLSEADRLLTPRWRRRRGIRTAWAGWFMG